MVAPPTQTMLEYSAARLSTSTDEIASRIKAGIGVGFASREGGGS